MLKLKAERAGMEGMSSVSQQGLKSELHVSNIVFGDDMVPNIFFSYFWVLCVYAE